jgi:ribosomal protein S18
MVTIKAFNESKLITLNYEITEILTNFINYQSKILPRRLINLNSKQQKTITKTIKKKRIAKLLPFVRNKK